MKKEKESDMLLHLPIIVVCTENDLYAYINLGTKTHIRALQK